MQSLAQTSSLGTAYTAQQVYQFLQRSGTENYIFDWLGPDFQYRGDLTRLITPDSTPQLVNDSTAAVPRSMRFQMYDLPSGLDVLSDMVRPHFKLSTPDGGTIDWTLATLLLNPPDMSISENGVVYAFTASDLATLLIDDEFPFSYSIPAGATYTDGVRGLLGSVGGPSLIFLGSLFDRQLPDSRGWDAEKTKLSAINDLLDSTASRPLWFDEMGQPRSARIPDYNLAVPDWRFDATSGQSPVVSSPLRETPNLAGIVNYCRVIGEDSRNGKPAISAVYENNQPDSPVSTSRYRGGRRKVKIIRDSSIADYESAYTKARATVQAGARVYGPVQFWTLNWPVWQSFDLLHFTYNGQFGATVDNDYLVNGWTMDLVPGGLTAHTVQRIAIA